MTATIHHGEALEWLRSLETASADALVTDPPAGIAFMGKGWDRDKGGRTAWVAWLAEILSEARRCLKPGTAGFVWALPRTSHWTATACEDAGFEVRDVVTHVQSQGFPKSKALLKPASEHWILVRNPGPLRNLRIDECRVGVESQDLAQMTGRSGKSTPNQVWGSGIGYHGEATWVPSSAGRFPANFALSHAPGCEQRGERRVKAAGWRDSDVSTDIGYGGGVQGRGRHYADGDGLETIKDWACEADCPVRLLGAQSGHLHGAGFAQGKQEKWADQSNAVYGAGVGSGPNGARYGDSGTAARFFPCFYQPKASKRDRGEGNVHPTVKSIALMRWLCRLVTPAGGLVLDPFTGSGTTGVAALLEGLHFAGCEREAEYVEIARARVAHAAPPPLPAQASQP